MQVQPWRTGAFVRNLRMEQGLTQRDLARLAGEAFGVEDIRRLERGTAGTMRPDRLAQVLAVLQSDLGALYRWSLLTEELIPVAPDRPIDLPVEIQARELAPTGGKFDQARQRLQMAMLAARETRNRSSELLAVSQRLRATWADAPAPTALDLSS